jgi:hypothetical protein
MAGIGQRDAQRIVWTAVRAANQQSENLTASNL